MFLAKCHYLCVHVYVFFFFKEKDGIRDLVGSRGLGFCKKRQGHRPPAPGAPPPPPLPPPGPRAPVPDPARPLGAMAQVRRRLGGGLWRESARARVTVPGCYATHAPEDLRALSPRVEAYSNAEKAALPACVGFEAAPEVGRLSRFTQRPRAFVKIHAGCNAPCRSCIIPHTHPTYRSQPAEPVDQQVRRSEDRVHGETVHHAQERFAHLARAEEQGHDQKNQKRDPTEKASSTVVRKWRGFVDAPGL